MMTQKLPTRTIHKLVLTHGHRYIQLPCNDAKALSVGVAQNAPCLWYDRPYDASQEIPLSSRAASVPLPESKVIDVEVLCVLTGEEYRLETDGWRFLGTTVHRPYEHSGDIIVHVFVKGF